MTAADYLSAPLREAIKLLEGGRQLEADDLLAEEKEVVLERYGLGSFEYARACFDHGYLCLLSGNALEGIQFLLEALAAAPRTNKAWHLSGSIAFQLGCAYNAQGQYAEAERVLRQCIDFRTRAFGENNLECHAAALELSEALIATGKYDSAYQILQSCISNFASARDILAFESLALKCVLDAVLQLETPELSLISQWEDGDLKLLIDRFKNRLATYAPEFQLRALERLCDASLRFLPDLKLLVKIELLRETAWKAKNCGEFARAEAYLNKSVGLASHFEDTFEVIRSLLLLGTVLQEASEIERAEQVILSALSEAQQEQSEQLTADGLRSYAKFLAATGRAAQAEPYFQQAVESARKADHSKALVLAETDHAMYLHHRGRYGEAHKMLMDIVERLDDDYFDVKTIRDHLDAINGDYSCGCYKDADVDQLVQSVIGQVDPENRLGEVLAMLDIGRSYKVQVHLTRAACPEEHELLKNCCEAVVSELKQIRRETNAARMRNGIA